MYESVMSSENSRNGTWSIYLNVPPPAHPRRRGAVPSGEARDVPYLEYGSQFTIWQMDCTANADEESSCGSSRAHSYVVYTSLPIHDHEHVAFTLDYSSLPPPLGHHLGASPHCVRQ